MILQPFCHDGNPIAIFPKQKGANEPPCFPFRIGIQSPAENGFMESKKLWRFGGDWIPSSSEIVAGFLGFNKTLSSSDIPQTWGICARLHFSRGSLPSIPRVFVKFFNGPLDVSKSAESSCELGVEMWPSSKVLVGLFVFFHLESVALCNYKTILGCPFLKGRICMKVAILEETQSYSAKFPTKLP